MTNYDKKNYLQKYQSNKLEIYRLQEEILRWESLAQKMTMQFDSIKGSSGEDRLQLAVEKIDELREQLIVQILQCVNLRETIEKKINLIQDERLRQLLKFHYIEGWTMEQIANEMHYSWRHVCTLHKTALEKL